MTIEERNLVRRRYAEYSRLPKQAQGKVKKLWKEQLAANTQEIPSEAETSAIGPAPAESAGAESVDAGARTR